MLSRAVLRMLFFTSIIIVHLGAYVFNINEDKYFEVNKKLIIIICRFLSAYNNQLLTNQFKNKFKIHKNKKFNK